MNLNEIKIPVFPNVNDAPVAPTPIRAGNGSDVIARYNQLVDAVQTLSQSTGTGIVEANELHPSGLEVYVDSVNGDDANDGTQERPFKTLAKTTQFLLSKQVNESLFLHLIGSFEEPLNLAGLRCGMLRFFQFPAELYIYFGIHEQAQYTITPESQITFPTDNRIHTFITPHWENYINPLIRLDAPWYITNSIAMIQAEFAYTDRFRSGYAIEAYDTKLDINNSIADPSHNRNGRNRGFIRAEKSHLIWGWGNTLSNFSTGYAIQLINSLMEEQGSTNGAGNTWAILAHVRSTIIRYGAFAKFTTGTYLVDTQRGTTLYDG